MTLKTKRVTTVKQIKVIVIKEVSEEETNLTEEVAEVLTDPEEEEIEVHEDM